MIEYRAYFNKYSGIYRTGGIGIVRISNTVKSSNCSSSHSFALKIFVDGDASVNLMGAHSFEISDCDSNFFKNVKFNFYFINSYLLENKI